MKDLIKNLYKTPEITKVFGEFKDQLKALHSFGMQYNEFKINQPKSNIMEQKGWLFVAQTFDLCDLATAQTVLKTTLRDKQEKGLSY